MNRIIGISLAILFVLLASSCRSRLNEQWGNSYRDTIALQTANPHAPAATEALETLDPETGKRVADRYYKGQEKQQQRVAPAVIIQGR